MATKIGSVVIDVDARLTKLEANLAKADKRFSKFDKDVRTAGGRIEASFKKIGSALAAFGVGLGAGALLGMASRIGETAKQLQNLSRIAGVGAEEFQSFAYAAKSVGFENDKVADILKDVNDKFGDFFQTGAGPLADFFEQIAPKIGVTADQFRALSGPQALQLYVSSLEKANVSQAEMTFYLEAIANDATALFPLLENGGQKLNNLEADFRNLGGAIQEEHIEKLIEAQAAWDRFMTAVQTRSVTFAGGVVQVFEDIGAAIDKHIANFVLSSPFHSEEAQQFAQDVLIRQHRKMLNQLEVDRKRASERLASVNLGGLNWITDPTSRRTRPSIGSGVKPKAAPKPPKEQISAIEQYHQSLDALNERILEVRDSLGLTWGDDSSPLINVPKATNAVLDLDKALRDAGDAATAAINQGLGPIAEEMERMDAAAEEFARTFSGAFEDAILSGDLDNALKGLLDDMARLIIRLTIIEPLAKSVARALSGGVSGGGLLSSVFGGFFADGGRPPMGKVSVVGERGPELFVPDTAGMIVPANDIGGGGIQQHFHVNAQGAVLAEGLVAEMRQIGATAAVAGSNMSVSKIRAGLSRNRNYLRG